MIVGFSSCFSYNKVDSNTFWLKDFQIISNDYGLFDQTDFPNWLECDNMTEIF